MSWRILKISKDKRDRAYLRKITLASLALGFFVAVLLISNLAVVYAESIYAKDGQVIKAKVTEKTDGTIWYETTSGDVVEYLGIDVAEVVKVLNDDGSVSEYSPTYVGGKNEK